jgi:hypothetical protein
MLKVTASLTKKKKPSMRSDLLGILAVTLGDIA